MSSMICGKCKNRHSSVDEVKSCYEGSKVKTFDFSTSIPTKYNHSNGLVSLVGDVPQKGDSITYMELTSYNPQTGIGVYDKVTKVVTEVIWWGDNSVEAFFTDGTKFQLIYPHGDAC